VQVKLGKIEWRNTLDVVARNGASSVDTCDKWRWSPLCKFAYSLVRFNKNLGDVSTCRILGAHNNHSRVVLFNRLYFRRSVSDVLVFRERYPSSRTHKRDPVFVWSVNRKVIVMGFDPMACFPQCSGNEMLA
jgi:hypothetical protein